MLDIDRGYQKLTRYAEQVLKDQEKAARLRAMHQEQKIRLEAERVDAATRHQDHLAAVAQEALRVDENGNFFHETKADVVRALKTKLTDGSDARLIPYTDPGLTRQVDRVGGALSRGAFFDTREHARQYVDAPLALVVALPQFAQVIPFEGWQQTLRYARGVLPEETTIWNIGHLLYDFSRFGKERNAAERVGIVKQRWRVR